MHIKLTLLQTRRGANNHWFATFVITDDDGTTPDERRVGRVETYIADQHCNARKAAARADRWAKEPETSGRDQAAWITYNKPFVGRRAGIRLDTNPAKARILERVIAHAAKQVKRYGP